MLEEMHTYLYSTQVLPTWDEQLSNACSSTPCYLSSSPTPTSPTHDDVSSTSPYAFSLLSNDLPALLRSSLLHATNTSSSSTAAAATPSSTSTTTSSAKTRLTPSQSIM